VQDESGARSVADSLMDANAVALSLGRSKTITQLTLGRIGGGLGMAGSTVVALSYTQLQEVRVSQILRAYGLEAS